MMSASLSHMLLISVLVMYSALVTACTNNMVSLTLLARSHTRPLTPTATSNGVTCPSLTNQKQVLILLTNQKRVY